MYMVLCGRGGASSERVWLEGRQKTLLPGQTDSFEVNTCSLVSPLEALVVGHNNTGLNPGWFLEEVRG